MKIKYAGVAELADAPDLGSGVPDVQVQVLSPALDKRISMLETTWESFFRSFDDYEELE